MKLSDKGIKLVLVNKIFLACMDSQAVAGAAATERNQGGRDIRHRRLVIQGNHNGGPCEDDGILCTVR